MSRASTLLFREGCLVGEVTAGSKGDPDASEFVWVDLYDPAPDALDAVCRRYDLGSLGIEKACSPQPPPRIDANSDDQLLVVAHSLHLRDDAFCYGHVAAFLGQGFIVTVRSGAADTRLPGNPANFTGPGGVGVGPDRLLHAILDAIVDDYLLILTTIEDDMLAIEDRVLDSFLSRDDVREVFRLRRELIRFDRILLPMIDVVKNLAREPVPCIDPAFQPYFRDVSDHLNRANALVRELRTVLTSMVEVSHMMEQQRTGANGRQLSAWAAVLAVPTAITGIYGMNFRYMPELEYEGGYFVVLGAIALLCLLVYLRFKKAGWL